MNQQDIDNKDLTLHDDELTYQPRAKYSWFPVTAAMTCLTVYCLLIIIPYAVVMFGTDKQLERLALLPTEISSTFENLLLSLVAFFIAEKLGKILGGNNKGSG